ncbi:MAG: type III-A CRISPR-associated RAMP protein Csm4 [Hydrogenothermus sp.]|nr:MAG: type III-A CRISPR-associated RAMP protein Csm4 [Hydrogenothermus sp.]
MKIYKVDINPVSPFRDYPSSYTLFGAICWGYWLLYGENKLKELLQKFANNMPPFILSSIFPKNQDTYLFPKPNLKAKRDENVSIKDYKELKKVAYVDFEILIEVLERKINNEFELNLKLKDKLEKLKVSSSLKDAMPHASIDRIYGTTEGSGQFFFEEFIAMKEGYLLIAIRDENTKKELESIFNLMQDIGIGGNRSIGYGKIIFGKFERFKELEDYINNQTKEFITLSPIIPEKETYDLKNSYYEYFTFRGAIDNNYDFKNVDIWKDKVIYLKEGSKLKIKENVNKNFFGLFIKTKDINGKHIYQYGIAFPLYIQGGN